jgi:hypothetical protein
MSCKPTYKGVRYNSLEELYASAATSNNTRLDLFQEFNDKEITIGEGSMDNDNYEGDIYPIIINDEYAGSFTITKRNGRDKLSIEEQGFFSGSIGSYGIELENDKFQGKGFGKRIYLQIAKELAKEGITLKSEYFGKNNIGNKANSIWQKLVNEGHAVDKGEYFEVINPYTPQQKQQALLSTSNNNQLDLFETSQAPLQPPIFIAEDGSTKHATENLGSFKSKKDPSPLLNKIKQRFRLVHPNGNVRNISYNENPERIAEKIEKEYPGVTAYVVQDVGGDYISLGVSPHLNVDNIYHQVESDMLADRDKEIDLAMAHFLKSIGVRIKGVDNIRDKNGKIISATAKADMVNKIQKEKLNWILSQKRQRISWLNY